MKTFKIFATATSALFLTLITAGVVPAAAASTGDEQAPRGVVHATTSDEQAPRGEAKASTGDVQAPRGQDTQAPATTEDTQAPRGN